MPGQINWFELPAADTAKARTFYGGLFGWSTNAFDGDYHLIDNGPEGAIAPREDGFTHPRVYFATDDVDASVKRVWTTTSPGTQHLRLVSVDRAGPATLAVLEPERQS